MTKFPCLTAGLEENKADLQDCYAYDEDIVIAGRFQSPELVKCSPDYDLTQDKCTHSVSDRSCVTAWNRKGCRCLYRNGYDVLLLY